MGASCPGRSHWLPWGQARTLLCGYSWGLEHSSFLLLPTVGFPQPHPFPYPRILPTPATNYPEMLKCLPVQVKNDTSWLFECACLIFGGLKRLFICLGPVVCLYHNCCLFSIEVLLFLLYG